MELVVQDAVVTIKPTDPNSKETIILKDATVVTNIKDPKDENAIIKLRPLKESVIEIELGGRRLS